MNKWIYSFEQLADYIGMKWSGEDLMHEWVDWKLPFEPVYTRTGLPVFNSRDVDAAISEGKIKEATESGGEVSDVPYAIRSKLYAGFAAFKELKELEKHFPHFFKTLGRDDPMDKWKMSAEAQRLRSQLQEVAEYVIVKHIELLEFQDRFSIHEVDVLLRGVHRGDQKSWNRLDREWKLAAIKHWEYFLTRFKNIYD